MSPDKSKDVESVLGLPKTKKKWKDVTPVITASKYHETRSRLFVGQFSAPADTQRPNAKCKCGSGKKHKKCACSQR
jgi:hypothetical protein